MTWMLTPEAEGWEPLPGVPWRDMTDAEFAEVAAVYDAQFEAGDLAKSRFFKHEKNTKPKEGD